LRPLYRVSTRSVGRVKCPKCGREGSLIVKSVGGKEYVYVKHGRTWHYVGPLDKVNVSSLLAEPTTALPLNGAYKGVGDGERVNGKSKPAIKVAAVVLALILIAIGAALAALTVLSALLLPYFTLGGIGMEASLSTEIPVNGTGIVYAILSSEGQVSVSVAARGCRFKALVAPASSVPKPPNASRLMESRTLTVYSVGAECVSNLLPSFSGDHTSYSAALGPEQALFVWPHEVSAGQPSLKVTVTKRLEGESRFQGDGTPVIAATIALVLAPPLLVAAALIAGGYLLYRWSRND